MLRMMMMQMGQKPSQKKINQMMTMMNKNMDQNMKSSKIIVIKGLYAIRVYNPLFCCKTFLVGVFKNYNSIKLLVM